MIHITEFENAFARDLPETHSLLVDSNLMVHHGVSRITLHGSRGTAGWPRSDSDVDLTLVLDSSCLAGNADYASLLNSVLSTSLRNWRGRVELDLAAAFDKSKCGLSCLDREEFDPQLCPSTIDCMGLYKVQKGFGGFVSGPFLEARKMYPLKVIWRKPE
ncbi:MAG: hypothetical protein GY866_30180 [Proteobacteria bacterium]|nr:hypothetical protein [Pseudomonadota bacterium]